MKAGTTSLAKYLACHPDVFMTIPKEPGFFDPTRNWDRGLEWYQGLFSTAGPEQARGEASTMYSAAPHVPGVPERIARVVPEVRLIYLIRNPVERIRSMYLHRVDRGQERGTLEEAVEQRSEYLDLSRYGFQLDQYLRVFPRQQILVLSSDQLRHERERAVGDALHFVGADADKALPDVSREHHRGEDKRRIWPLLEGPRSLLRKSGIMAVIPRSVKVRSRHALSGPIPEERTQIDPQFASHLWSLLSEDLGRLRQIVGPEFYLWDRA